MKLDQYKERLSPAEIADGINAAQRNAQRLAIDARILLQAGSHATAAAIAALSIEEAGKTSILRQLALAATPADIKATWRDYRSHTSKSSAWILPQLVARGARKLDDFFSLFDPDSDHPDLLNQVKQIALYTDCYGERHWSEPTNVLTAELATQLVLTAEVLAKGSIVTAREIELWVEHLGPVWKRDPAWLRKALENWYSALQAEGLKEPGPNRMAGFIWDRPSTSGENDA